MYRNSSIALLLFVGGISAGMAQTPSQPVTTQLQQIVDDYLAQRQQIEKITGIELQVSLDGGQQVLSGLIPSP